jgi:hypothetical protein
MPSGTGAKLHNYTQGACVYNSAALSIPDITATVVGFDSEWWDTDSIHDNVTNNSRLTCQTAGKYAVFGRITFASNATGIRYAKIESSAGGPSFVELDNAVSGTSHAIAVAGIFDLAVGDYLQLTVYQNSGVALDIYAYASFGMHRIG